MSQLEDLLREIQALRTQVDQLNRQERPNQALDTTSAVTLGSLNLNSSGAVTGQIVTSGAGGPIFTISDAGTTTSPENYRQYHKTSGTPAAGFGSLLLFTADDNGASNVNQASFVASWTTATDASRASRFQIFCYDNVAAREGLRIEATGAAVTIGFLGSAAVARQASGGAAPAGGTGTAAGGWDTAAHRDSAITTLNNLRTGLINLGLFS